MRADIATVTVMRDGAPFEVAYNSAESPLAALCRRKAKDGTAYLTQAEFAAGERLRADFTRGQLSPRLGIDWQRAGSGASRTQGANGARELCDSALAARMRVNAAFGAVGPELSGILADICCFLKGLETVERERQWPVRSAKIMLKAALSALARHYNPKGETPPRQRRHHWGAPDYKPTA